MGKKLKYVIEVDIAEAPISLGPQLADLGFVRHLFADAMAAFRDVRGSSEAYVSRAYDNLEGPEKAKKVEEVACRLEAAEMFRNASLRMSISTEGMAVQRVLRALDGDEAFEAIHASTTSEKWVMYPADMTVWLYPDKLRASEIKTLGEVFDVPEGGSPHVVLDEVLWKIRTSHADYIDRVCADLEARRGD